MSSALVMLVSLGAVAALIFAFVWAWVAWYERRPFSTLGLEPGGALHKYLRGLILGVVTFAAVVLVMVLLGDVASDRSDPGLRGTAALGGVLVVYSAWMVQGPAEELLCRGFLLQAVVVGFVGLEFLSALTTSPLLLFRTILRRPRCQPRALSSVHLKLPR